MKVWTLIALAAACAAGCNHEGACGGKALLIDVSGNHGHAESISAAALERGAGVYRITGGTHEHLVRLEDSTLAQLKSGASVDLRSSSANGHVHALRLRCAK